MSALKKLLDFADQLPTNTGIEFLQLVQAYQKEMIADKMQLIEKYERIIRGTQNTPPYEVVAVAGTVETLLNEINVGDTVECIAEMSKPIDNMLDPICYKGYRTDVVGVYGGSIFIPFSESGYKKSDFRKVSTLSTNPHQTVQGC
jgi:hypothetical protein